MLLIHLISEWGKNNYQLFQIIDAVIFLFFLIAVLYLLIFAIASLGKSDGKYPETTNFKKILVVFSYFQDDDVIIESILNFRNHQDYPTDRYSIFIIGTQFTETHKSFFQENALKYLESDNGTTKIGQLKSLILQTDIDEVNADIILLLESNNLVDTDMLRKINNAYYAGCDAVQTHRIAKERETSVQILDAVSEEINNSIFRKGHTRLGFSSALIGSGMAFDYQLFRDTIMKAQSHNIDKYLEREFLKNDIYIEYLESVFTYDEKATNEKVFYQQRNTWIANHFWNLYKGILYLPLAFFQRKWDYCDKLFQWMMPSRVVLLGMIFILAFVITIISWTNSIKWWGLLLLLIITLIIAIPNYLVDNKLRKAIYHIPYIFILMLRGFVHFNHGLKSDR